MVTNLHEQEPPPPHGAIHSCECRQLTPPPLPPHIQYALRPAISWLISARRAGTLWLALLRQQELVFKHMNQKTPHISRLV